MNQISHCTQQNLTTQAWPFLSFTITSYHTPSPGHTTSFISLESRVFSFFNFGSRNKDHFCLFVMFFLLPLLSDSLLPSNSSSPLRTLNLFFIPQPKGSFWNHTAPMLKILPKLPITFRKNIHFMFLWGGCTIPVTWCLPILHLHLSTLSYLPSLPLLYHSHIDLSLLPKAAILFSGLPWIPLPSIQE